MEDAGSRYESPKTPPVPGSHDTETDEHNDAEEAQVVETDKTTDGTGVVIGKSKKDLKSAPSSAKKGGKKKK